MFASASQASRYCTYIFLFLLTCFYKSETVYEISVHALIVVAPYIPTFGNTQQRYIQGNVMYNLPQVRSYHERHIDRSTLARRLNQRAILCNSGLIGKSWRSQAIGWTTYYVLRWCWCVDYIQLCRNCFNIMSERKCCIYLYIYIYIYMCL